MLVISQNIYAPIIIVLIIAIVFMKDNNKKPKL